MSETADRGLFTEVPDTKIYSMFVDEPSNRFHLEIERGGNIFIVDIQGWFRELVKMPDIQEVDAL